MGALREYSEQTSIEDYLKLMMTVDNSVLTREQEVEYFKKIAKGDVKAKQEFADHNLRLVISVAKQFVNPTKRKLLSVQDLIQEGNIGLMTAIEKFDYKLGNKFSTYAVDWIKQSIDRSIDKTGRTIKVPSTRLYVIKQFTKIKSDIQKETGMEPSFEEVSRKLEWTDEYIKECLGLGIEPLSMSSSSPTNSEYDKKLEDVIGDKYEDTNSSSEIENIVLNDALKQLFDEYLNSEETYIISHLFGLTENRIEETFDEIAEALEITKEKVIIIQKHAFAKLRSSGSLEVLKDFI